MNEKALLELLEAIVSAVCKLRDDSGVIMYWETRAELQDKLDKLKGLSNA